MNSNKVLDFGLRSILTWTFVYGKVSTTSYQLHATPVCKPHP